MTSPVATHSFAQQWDCSLKSEAGLLCATPVGRQQKMMKQRQLALARQANLVRGSIRTVQQNDLPLTAARLPKNKQVFPHSDEHLSCAQAAAADVSAVLNVAEGTAASISGLREMADTFGERPETASLSLSTESPGGPLFPGYKPSPNGVMSPIASPSRAASCWEPALTEQDPSPAPDAAKDRPAAPRFWRPWRSSKRSVTISDEKVTAVEPTNLVTAFGDQSIDSLDYSFGTGSAGTKSFKSSSSRAATPWQAAPAERMEEQDFEAQPQSTPSILEGAKDASLNTSSSPSRVQLPIMPRRHSSEPSLEKSGPREIWIGASTQPNFSSTLDGDVAPRSLRDTAGDGDRHQLKQSLGSRFSRLKIWNGKPSGEAKIKAAPAEAPKAGISSVTSLETDIEDFNDGNLVTSFEEY